MHSKSDNIKILINDEANEVIEEFFQSLLSRYQTGLETSMKGREFVLDCVYLLYYKCHKINLNRSGSYIDGLDWTKKATINSSIKNDNKCFQYTVTVALNYEDIKEYP